MKLGWNFHTNIEVGMESFTATTHKVTPMERTDTEDEWTDKEESECDESSVKLLHPRTDICSAQTDSVCSSIGEQTVPGISRHRTQTSKRGPPQQESHQK